MSDIDYDAFRAETRAWLEANCPASMRTPPATDRSDNVMGGSKLEKHVRVTYRTYYDKYETFLGAKWLLENMEPGEKALVFGSNAFPEGSATKEQLVKFGNLKAEDHDGLIDEAAARGIDYVVYWYRPGKPEDPDDVNYQRNLYYYERYKVWLAEPFREGAPVTGFQHVRTIPVPEHLGRPDVQIYRYRGAESRPRSG